MKKTFGILVAIFFIHTLVHAADKIRIGVPVVAVQFITMPLAQKRGFLKEEGLEAEMIRIPVSPVSGALSRRELDYYLFIGPQAAIAGLPIRVVACYVPTTFIVLMAQPRFKSVKDLKDGSIAVNTF